MSKKKIAELKQQLTVDEQRQKLVLELEELLVKAKQVDPGSPEGVRLSIIAAKKINKMLDFE